MTKLELISKYILKQIEGAEDPAEYVYNLTGEPKLAVNFLRFHKHGQVEAVLDRMSQQDEDANHVYMERLINKGKAFIKG